ncbi:glycosyltransferase family 4 protein [Prosthecobacter sp.]|uniref:glycosyltransferase family 4 protein n=1 Tax=Prosthecobacter sp. TaxID=1965333 RepID=UPI0037838CB3
MTGILSINDPSQTGGLASYQRQLADALSALGLPGWFGFVQTNACGPTHDVSWKKTKLSSKLPWHILRRIFYKLAPRPALHGALESLAGNAWSESSFQGAISGTGQLHFVGTGWDFMGLAAARLAKKKGMRFTIWPAVHPGDWGDDRIDVRFYRQADAVFCQSDYERNHLAKLGVPESKLIRCGLPPMCRTDGDGPRLRAKLNLADRPTVLFLGRRDVGKGYPALLEAWPLVLQQCPDAVLLLAGPGDADQARLAQIPSKNIRDLGCPSEQEKADAYAACDIFALPSAHESFGIVYVEAWSYGKPVICGTAPASRELVENGVTGVWADQQPQQLAASLLRLLMHPTGRLAMGQAGFAHQQRHYTTAQTVACHLKAWNIASPN